MNTLEKNNRKKNKAVALSLTLLLHLLAIAALLYISQPKAPDTEAAGSESVTNVQP